MQKIKPTPSEQLVLSRRRLGLSQTKFARRKGVKLPQLKRMEHGGEKPLSTPPLGKLTNGERCWVMRKRANKTQKQVAQELGKCRYWINLMETDKVAVDELLWYWEC